MTITTNIAATAARGRRDEHGNPISGSADAVAQYDHVLDRLLVLSDEVIPATEKLLTEHPDVPMGYAAMAYLVLSGTDEPGLAGAREAWEAMGNLTMVDREVAHHGAIGAWLDGDWGGASARLDDLLQRWPADLLALWLGHQLDFFRGDAQNLRDRVARSLQEVDRDHPHYGAVQGMYAFGLEESGQYERAEQSGLAALAVSPRNVWALHAVAHTYEMRGRTADAIPFMVGREADWGRDNLLAVHNWWHLAVFLLEAGAYNEVLGIYDAEIHNAGSDNMPLEMLDASALLWRLTLDGVDTGGRFGPLAEAWMPQVTAPAWYAFNDVHATIALVGADRITEAEQLIERRAGYVHQGGPGSNVQMTAQIGLPASRAMVRFAQGRYADVVDELLPIRRTFQLFGGSHAQRDVLQRTLLEAAIRSGQHQLAGALTSERVSARDTTVYGWSRRAQALEASGHPDKAADARDTAQRQQALASTAFLEAGLTK
jgi:tetratricopeptide (TPR) repeat protein